MPLARNIVSALWAIAATFWLGVYVVPGSGGYAVALTIIALCATVLGGVYEVLYE